MYIGNNQALEIAGIGTVKIKIFDGALFKMYDTLEDSRRICCLWDTWMVLDARPALKMEF